MSLWEIVTWPYPRLRELAQYNINAGNTLTATTFTCPNDPPGIFQLSSLGAGTADVPLADAVLDGPVEAAPWLPTTFAGIPDRTPDEGHRLLATVRIGAAHDGLFPSRVCDINGLGTDAPGPQVGDIEVDDSGAAVYPHYGPDDPDGTAKPAAQNVAITVWYSPGTPLSLSSTHPDQDVIVWYAVDVPGNVSLPWTSDWGKAGIGGNARITIYVDDTDVISPATGDITAGTLSRGVRNRGRVVGRSIAA